jgi:hypothetical protein
MREIFMIQSANLIGTLSAHPWLAQVPATPGLPTPEAAALVFSGPKFFVALISGVILAFAFQLLLTNLSVAAGISFVGRSGHDDPDNRDQHHAGTVPVYRDPAQGGELTPPEPQQSSHSSGFGIAKTIRKISFAVGIWTLITVTIALFVACLLAVRLSLLANVGLGAIVGLVIWGAYFSLLVLVSSTTVGSLIGSLVNTATSGFQALLGTATSAIGARSVNQQIVSTAEAAAAAVRRELGTGATSTDVRDSLEDYLERLRPGQIDMRRMRRELEDLINDPELQNLVGADSPEETIEYLRSVDRNTFVNLLRDRTDLSKREAKQIADQLDSIWRDIIDRHQRYQRKDPTQDLVDYLKTVQAGQVNTNEIQRRLDQLAEEVRRQGQVMQTAQTEQVSAMRDQMSTMRDQMSTMRDQTSQMSNMGERLSSMVGMGQGGNKQGQPSVVDRALQFGFTTLMGTVLGRTDLSDLDVEKILGQIQSTRDKVAQGTQQITGQAKSSFNPIRTDVEHYLHDTYAWQMNRETLEREFRDVLYDPEADPATVQRYLEQINRGDFVNVLSQRGMITPERIEEIADQLEAIRLDVLNTVRTDAEREYVVDLANRVSTYLRSTRKDALTVEAFDRDLTSILEDPDADYDTEKSRLDRFERSAIMETLMERGDMTEDEANYWASEFERVRDRVLTNSLSAQERVRSEASALRARVESYLRNTNKEELRPEAIEREFRLLVEDPQAGASALRYRLSQFDRGTLIQLLSQRQDITPDEANRIVSQLESVRDNVLHAPQLVAHQAQVVADKAKEQSDQVLATIETYLRNTHRDELDPEGIRRDLDALIHDPRTGLYRLRARLSRVDRDTLVSLLSQRQDLSDAQVNQIIDQVQQSIRGIVRSPRRFTSRTQRQVQSFQMALEDYLRNTNKEELNPEGIKRDLQLMLRDPRAGFGNLGSRLSHLDRDALVALLAQRKDMTEAEASRIVDQVLSVREQFTAQIQAVQNRIQSVVDTILNRIRNYLNSLERPELNYEGIRDDIRQLFNDPKAGFDALRDRLSSFNRETLIAILSSRDDIAESDIHRVIDQIEHTRSNVLRRAERIQQETQRRLDEVKRQAKQEAEETRKAAESAAWWVFGTAIVSAIGSAIAGALAVVITPYSGF